MIEFWKSLNSPKSEEDIIQKWYGCIYNARKKNHLYVGKAVRRFMDDVNGPVTALEIESLKPHVGSGNILESIPEHLERDIDVFPIFNVIDGPLKVIPLKGGRWEVSAYESLKQKFEAAIIVDRKTLCKEL